MDDLNELIEEAYALFSPYELGSEMAVCTYCCLSTSDVETLNKIPLRQLDRVTIYEYLGAATSGNGELLINQMRYLLPRILELLVAGEEIRHSTEISLDKLHCDNLIWHENELYFLRRFAKHYMEYHIETIDNINTYDIIDIAIMFDTAKLRTKSGQPFVKEVFNFILKNAHHQTVIDEMMGEVNNGSVGIFASDLFTQTFYEFTHSQKFKDTFTNAILHNIEDENLTQDAHNFYEVAFNTFVYL